MKKAVKKCIVIISALLAILLAGGLLLYLTSPFFKLSHAAVQRAYIYHNELEREYYTFTDEEEARLEGVVRNADIGGRVSDEEYEPAVGSPWFSFFYEFTDGSNVQLYCDGRYLFINSVPFEVDDKSAGELLSLHNDIENKILPITDEEYNEILQKQDR